MSPIAAHRPVVVGLGAVDPLLVTGILGDEVSFVADPGSEDLAGAVGAIVRADAVVDAAFLDCVPRLRVLARTGVGVDLIDLPAASARGIPVVITPGAGTRAVAEGVLAMALHLVKRLGPLTDLVRQNRWADRARVPVGDLDGATMGIVGYGRIGRRVGELAEAFGMRLVAYDPFNRPPSGIASADLAGVASASNVVTLHVPLTNQTHHLVDKAFLDHIQPGAVLINCGRGGLVDLDAALAALQSGRLAGVGLDVFDPEPPSHHPLFDHPNVVLTPHLMGLTRRAMAATFADAARGVVDVLNGRSPAAVANPDWADPHPSTATEHPSRRLTEGLERIKEVRTT
ncbi:MAG TPA: NAD(P)-dependent oxidoreductase [Dermatophilaceae bacterium]|nr:NAD(P)-dependent oxidoreductase [Dermatophilaceae bacterium]